LLSFRDVIYAWFESRRPAAKIIVLVHCCFTTRIDIYGAYIIVLEAFFLSIRECIRPWFETRSPSGHVTVLVYCCSTIKSWLRSGLRRWRRCSTWPSYQNREATTSDFVLVSRSLNCETMTRSICPPPDPIAGHPCPFWMFSSSKHHANRAPWSVFHHVLPNRRGKGYKRVTSRQGRPLIFTQLGFRVFVQPGQSAILVSIVVHCSGCVG